MALFHCNFLFVCAGISLAQWMQSSLSLPESPDGKILDGKQKLPCSISSTWIFGRSYHLAAENLHRTVCQRPQPGSDHAGSGSKFLHGYGTRQELLDIYQRGASCPGASLFPNLSSQKRYFRGGTLNGWVRGYEAGLDLSGPICGCSKLIGSSRYFPDYPSPRTGLA